MYLGKAVRFQHRVATGHARLQPLPAGAEGVRVHGPVPTDLVVADALVLLETPGVPDGEPRLTLLYNSGGKALNGEEWKAFLKVEHDVPHVSDTEAIHGRFWDLPHAPVIPVSAELESQNKALLEQNVMLKLENDSLRTEIEQIEAAVKAVPASDQKPPASPTPPKK